MAAATSFVAAAAPTNVPLPAEPVHGFLVPATVLMSICGPHVPVILCCCRAATAAAGRAAAALAHPVGVPLPVPVQALAPPACQGIRSATAECNVKASTCLPTGACQALHCCNRRQPVLGQFDGLSKSQIPQLHAQLASPPGRVPVMFIPRAPVRISLPPAAIFTV